MKTVSFGAIALVCVIGIVLLASCLPLSGSPLYAISVTGGIALCIVGFSLALAGVLTRADSAPVRLIRF